MEITKQELSIIKKAGKLSGENSPNLINSLAKALPIIIVASIIVVMISSFTTAEVAQKYALPILFGLAIVFGGVTMAHERKLLQLIKKQDQIIKNLEEKHK